MPVLNAASRAVRVRPTALHYDRAAPVGGSS